MSKEQDLQYGDFNEKNALPIISSFLKTDLKKESNTYSLLDFSNESKSVYVELKSRRINHDQFPTALIGLNKIKFCINPDVKYYFVWLYKDGIYYLKYDKDLFDKFIIQDDYKIKFRYDVGKSEISKVVHIPYKYLKKMENISLL